MSFQRRWPRQHSHCLQQYTQITWSSSTSRFCVVEQRPHGRQQQCQVHRVGDGERGDHRREPVPPRREEAEVPVFGCLAAGFVCLAAALADVPFGAAGLALAGALVFVGAFALAGALVFAEALAFRGRAAAGALAFLTVLATALV